MTSKTPGRTDLGGAVYRKLRALAIARSNGICVLCGEAIDLTLSGRHRDGPTLEHIIPVSLGGNPWDPANHGVSHLRCNSARQNKTIEAYRAELAKKRRPSRNWFGR